MNNSPKQSKRGSAKRIHTNRPSGLLYGESPKKNMYQDQMYVDQQLSPRGNQGYNQQNIMNRAGEIE